MSTLSSALMALGIPLVKKVLVSLGIGTLTYVGLTAAVSAGLGAAKSNFAGLPSDVLQIAAMSGLFTAASIIAGGVTSALTLMSFSRLAKIA